MLRVQAVTAWLIGTLGIVGAWVLGGETPEKVPNQMSRVNVIETTVVAVPTTPLSAPSLPETVPTTVPTAQTTAPTLPAPPTTLSVGNGNSGRVIDGPITTPSATRYMRLGCEANTHQVFSPGGKYYGKYQFDRQTWAAHGGDPSRYGNATEAEQDAVAARVRYDAWPSC